MYVNRYYVLGDKIKTVSSMQTSQVPYFFVYLISPVISNKFNYEKKVIIYFKLNTYCAHAVFRRFHVIF